MNTHKIFSRFWVARDNQGSLAYLCHLGDGKEKEDARKKNARQRINNNKEDGLIEEEFDNTPTSGFEITDIMPGYRGTSGLWRIRDPRGFDVTIQSHHLMDLIADCTIENGIIRDKLVWARNNTSNFPVPVTSEVYQNAIDGDRHVLIKTISIPQMHTYLDGHGARPHYLGKNREGGHIKAQWYDNKGDGFLYTELRKSAPRAKPISVEPIDGEVFKAIVAKAKSSGTLSGIPASEPVEFVFVEKRSVRVTTYDSDHRGQYVKCGDHFVLLNSIWNPKDFRAYRADGSSDKDAASRISAQIWDPHIGWGGQRSASFIDAEIYKLA